MKTPFISRPLGYFHPLFQAFLLSLAISGATVSTAQADTIGYWRFEAGNELADSSTNGHTLTAAGGSGSPAQYALPATGLGSAFPKDVGGAANAYGIKGNGANNTFQNRQLGTNISAATTNLASELSVEAFFDLTNSSATSSSVIVGQGVGEPTSGASWGLVVTSGNSTAGAQNLVFQYTTSGGAWSSGTLIDTNLVINLNVDYYVAVT